jgi:hypothetical protein
VAELEFACPLSFTENIEDWAQECLAYRKYHISAWLTTGRKKGWEGSNMALTTSVNYRS